MKLTYEQKVQIYHDWKSNRMSAAELAEHYHIALSNIKYLVELADRHGVSALEHKYTSYTSEFKLNAIYRVLKNHESAHSVSLDLRLSAKGTLPRWVKEYVSNGYNIVEKKKGRKPNGSQTEEDCRGTREGESGSAETKQGASPEERDSFDTDRILKKIRRLGFGKREIRKEEIAQAVTELRQETRRSLRFILNAIAGDASLPQLPRSDYYYYMNHQDPDEKHNNLMNAIRQIYYDNHGRYGYRRITAQLRNDGWNVNHKTVKRLMKKMELFGITPKAKYKSYKGDFNGTVDNLLLTKEVDEEAHKTTYKRHFETAHPNEKWTTDVSEFHIAAGKMYLSPILDVFNGEIISYNISIHPNFHQVIDMLEKAFEKYTDLEGLIFHSDQGWQYQMAPYHRILKEHGIRQSMSRKGNCLDNCVMENFFGKLKNEMFYGHEYEFETLDQLKKAIEDYIEYYNQKRIQIRLKGLTPCQAREQALQYC